MPYKDKGTDWSDAFKSQGTPKIANEPPEAGKETWNGFSLAASRTNPDNILIFDFWPPEQ